MLKNISRILMLGLVVTSGSVHATNNICVTLTDCERLVSQKQLEIEMITARITMLKPMPKFEPLLKHIDFFTGPTKELKYRTYEKAMAECPKGTRLPTIRELARDAQAQGAKGILEVYQVRKNDVPPGYELFVVLNPDKIKDQFYYNSDGYKAPEGEIGQNHFWSSSVPFSNSSWEAYSFNGSIGSIFTINRGMDPIGRGITAAIRCVRND